MLKQNLLVEKVTTSLRLKTHGLNHQTYTESRYQIKKTMLLNNYAATHRRREEEREELCLNHTASAGHYGGRNGGDKRCEREREREKGEVKGGDV